MPKQAGNSIETALDITTLDTNIKIFEDTISDTDSRGYYKFTIAENSKLNIKLSGLSQNVDLFLIDADGSQINQSSVSGNADENIIQNLRAGSYYFYVVGGATGTDYKIETSAISLGAIPADNAGSTFNTAKNIGTLGTTAIIANDFIGNFNEFSSDSTDYYQFTIAENSTVNLKFSGLNKDVSFYLLSQDASLSLPDNILPGFVPFSATGNADEDITKNLRAGTYYVRAVGRDNGNGTNYQFEASAVPLGVVPVDKASDSFGRAKNIGTLDTKATIVNDFIGNFNGLATDDRDVYQFTLAENSTINLKLSGLSQQVTIRVSDSEYRTVERINGTLGEDITYNLRAGNHYIEVFGARVGDGTNYQFEASAVSLGAVPVDNAGDSFERAKNIGTLGTTAIVTNDFIGNFNGLAIDDTDYYQFTITENSTVNLNLSGLSQDATLYLFDSQQGFVQLSANTVNADENITKNLRAGTYYVNVSTGGNGTNYQFEASAVSLDAVPVDNAGDSFERAKNLGTLGTTAIVTNDFIGNFNGLATDDTDYYQFTIAENSTVNLKLSGLSQDATLYLYDSQQGIVQQSANIGNADENITKNLRAGTYYVRASGGGNGTNYQFEASAVSLGSVPVDNNPIYQASDLGILGSVAKIVDEQVGSSTPDYYKFILTENSTIDLKLSGLSQDANLQLFSNTGTNLKNSVQAGTADENISQNLRADTYYLQVNGGGTGTNYKLEASAISIGDFPIDNAGQSIDTAKDLGVLNSEVVSSTDFVGSFNGLSNDGIDSYKFTLTENSTIDIKLSGLSQDANLQLFSNIGNLFQNSLQPGTNDENINQNLRAGTYYLQVNGGESGTNYKLDASAISLGAFPVDNAGQNIDTAKDLGILTSTELSSTDYVGDFNGLASDNSDYYKFNITENSNVNARLDNLSQDARLTLLSSNGKSISLGFNTDFTYKNVSQILTSGTYYLAVNDSGRGTNYKLDANAVSVGAIIDNAGQNIDTAKDLGILKSELISTTDFIGNFYGLDRDNNDYYKFTLLESGTVNIKLSNLIESAGLLLLGSSGDGIKSSSEIVTTVQSQYPDRNINKTLKAGTYYLRINSETANGTSYKLDVDLTDIPIQTSGFNIATISPIKGSNQGEASIDIKGTKFTSTAKVSIVDPSGKEVISSAVTVLNDTNIAAKFDLKGQVIGAYDVKVVDGTNEALVNDIFLVNDLAPGRLQVDIAAPAAVRPGTKGELIITYRNAGNTDIPAPLLTLVANGALLEESGEYKDGTIQFLGINKEGNAGVLPAGATGSVRVKFRAALDATNIDFQVNSLALDENVDWNGIKDSSRPEGIAADVWDKIYSNFVTSVGGKASEFEKVLNDNANRLSQLGEYTGDISRLLSFELQQVNSNAISARSTVGAFGRGGVNPWDVTAITDAAGNVAIQTGDRRRTFTKGKDGKYQGITDDLGSLTKVGDVYQIKEFDGTIQSFLANGKLDFIQDTNGNKVTLGYTDSLLTGLSYSNGDKVSFKYNAQGRVNEIVDIYGQSTTYTYDATGERLLSVSDVSGKVSYAYETEGAKANAIKSITYPDGTQSLFEYDDLGRVTQESLNGGEQTLKYSYDSTGGVTVTDASNKSTQVLLNDRGQVAQTTDALGRVSRFSYDDKGNLTQVLAPDSSNAKFSYDSKGNLLASTDALGQSVQFAYDSRYDQIANVTDQKGNAINYTYDDKGNLGSIGYADGSKESFTYSDKGDVTVSSNRRGQQISYTYDSRGLLTKKDFADGTSAAFEYDVRGNLTKATDADSSVTYGYDAADRLTNVSYGGTRSLSFSYDAGGRRNQMVDQDGFATNYSYDSVGRLKQLTDKDAKSIVSYSYNTLGQLSREDNGNGTYTAYTYDDAGQALSIVNYKPDNSINSRYDYTYNQLGQRTSMTTLEGKTSYGYDATGQLTSVALASGRNIEYKYDAAGNRITVKDSGATTNYSTNNLNQYTTVGGDAYTYDKDGNLTSKTIGGKTSSFSYDIENRLIGVTNADGTWQYQYDALGNRIGSTLNGQKTDYLLDPTGLGDVVGEYTSSQATRYSHGLGLASRNDGTNTSFFDTDAIGSVVGLSGTGGNYLNSYSYLPFGESLTKTETVANSFEYVGQYGVMNEANGLEFMRARFYTPGEGRFLNPDPIGVNGGVNLYGYVENNPTESIDPTGLINWDTFKQGAENTFYGGAGLTGLGLAAFASDGAAALTPLFWILLAEAFYKYQVGLNQLAFGLADSELPGDGRVTGSLARDSLGGLGEIAGGPGGRKIGEGVGDIADIIPRPGGIKSKSPGNTSSPPKNAPTPTQNIDKGVKKWKKIEEGAKKIGEGVEEIKEKKQEATGSTQTRNAFDPNDIIGPGGTGTDRWLTPDPILPYTIRFENQATATAPAVLVNITHTLDSDLDLNTFELGDFGFGSTTITVPDGLQNYTTRLDLRDTIGDFVDFTATLDTATRVVTWKIITIDPLTGEPAEGVTDGFLPPNNANRDGDGFVNYRIKAKSDTPNGASLDAQASIVFDTNAPIVTPIWSNKIDTNAPTSKVQTLTATNAGKDIKVTWAGADDGSGVGKYDVYVAVDGGNYTLWQNKTDKTTATYTGDIGKTYSFYSVATDGVGRTETKTAVAETTTKLIEIPTVPTVPTVPTIPTITITVTDADTAETRTGELANPGQFTFKRTGDTTNSLTVNYSLTGNATNGTDYQKLGNTITFAAGSNTTTLDINPIDDKRYEGTETVTLTLLDGGTQYKLDPSNSGTVSIVDNDPQTPKLTQPLPNILSIEGGSDRSTLKFTKIAQEGAGKNETFAFVVDDDKGRIGGIAPGSEGYLKAALDRSKVIFSNLGNNSIDRTFDLGSQRSLTFAPGDLVEFGSIVGDTIDKVKLDLISGKPTSEVLFSLPSANAGNGDRAKFTPLPNDGGYEIAWSNADTKTTPVYNDLVFKVESINNFTAPIGTNLQGNGEGEVLDLRSFAGQTLKIDTVAVSDAGYNNNIGFYAVADAQGTLANGLKVTDVGYAEAAIKSAILRSFKNETQLDRQVAGGEILAPVVIANGTFEDFLETNPQNQANSNIHAYFNYLGANTDKVDHFRLLGDNKFGVEDLYGGGDRDYNDVVFQLNIKV